MPQGSEPPPSHLPPNSSLAKPLAFARMTMDVEIQCALRELDTNEELRSQTGKVLRTLPPEYIQLRNETIPCYSLMTDDEAEALLTFPGTVWFLEQATGLYAERSARICALGQPWPVWSTRANFLLSTPALSLDHAAYLMKLFCKTDRRIEISNILYKSELENWEENWGRGQSSAGKRIASIEPPDAYWTDLAEKAGEHIHAICWVATALEIYLHCLIKYATRRGIEHTLREESNFNP